MKVIGRRLAGASSLAGWEYQLEDTNGDKYENGVWVPEENLHHSASDIY